MRDEFANRLNMFRTVQLTLNLPEHLAVWQGQPPLAFTTIVAAFTPGLTDLETFVTGHGMDTTGAAVDKRREEEELETAAHQLGSALASWLRSQSDETNAARVERSLSGWRRLRGEQLLQQSQIVIDVAQAEVSGPNANGAATWGVTPAAVTALTAERDDYHDIVAKPQQQIAARKALTAQYRARFNAVEAHLEDLDNLSLQYRATAAGRAFVAAYQASRVIRDLGHGPSTPPASPAPNP